MKKIFLVTIVISIFVGCSTPTKKKEVEIQKTDKNVYSVSKK